jgi:peptide deformylase
MAILKVARMGHPVLRTPAEPIPPEEVSSLPVQQLIEDMLDTCDEYEGIGLAAPQVHFPVQVVILEIDEAGPTVWINPELTPLTDELIYTFEGCLSVPGLRGLVGRPASVAVKALDRQGQPIELELEGFPAVVAQHECDHLQGNLYVDKVVPRTLTFLEEHQRYASWGTEEEEDELEDELEDDAETGETENISDQIEGSDAVEASEED